MNRPATADDQLPAGFDKLPVAERVSDFAGARLARSVGGQKYYIVPGKSSSICLFWTSGEGDRIVGSGTCGARSEVNSKGVYLVSGGAPDKVSVAVIAPDGYDKATKLGEEVAVTNNLALFTAGEIGSVVLHGPNLTEQRIDLKDEGEPTPSISGTSN